MTGEAETTCEQVPDRDQKETSRSQGSGGMKAGHGRPEESVAIDRPPTGGTKSQRWQQLLSVAGLQQTHQHCPLLSPSAYVLATHASSDPFVPRDETLPRAPGSTQSLHWACAASLTSAATMMAEAAASAAPRQAADVRPPRHSGTGNHIRGTRAVRRSSPSR